MVVSQNRGDPNIDPKILESLGKMVPLILGNPKPHISPI